MKTPLSESRMRENRTSGLMSGRVETEIWKDIQAPATERVGLSYGLTYVHRATSRLYKSREVMKSKAQTGNRRGSVVPYVTKRFAGWNAALGACRF